MERFITKIPILVILLNFSNQTYKVYVMYPVDSHIVRVYQTELRFNNTKPYYPFVVPINVNYPKRVHNNASACPQAFRDYF